MRLVPTIAVICALLAAGAACANDGEPECLQVGVVSDIHLGNNPGKKEVFVRVLRFFRERNVDAVMIPGDMTDFATAKEWQRVADAWREVFPDDKAPDGHVVERLFVTGNHDCGRADLSEIWRESFHETYAPIWIKTVKGYVFTGAQWGATGGLARFYKEHASSFGGDKPFFHVQHAHPHGTCIGDWAWGNEPHATAVLLRHPNAVAISGHSHYSLTDERSIWQGSFTSVNAGTLSHDCHEYSMHDNARGNSYSHAVMQPDRLTPDVGTVNGKACMVMTVTESEIRLERYSFLDPQPLSLGPDWVIPVGRGAPKPYAFAAHAARRSAPAFAPGSAVVCTPCRSTRGPGAGRSCLKVSFPPARTVDGCRVFDYEVTASVIEDDVALPIKVKRVLAPGYFLPEGKANLPGLCLFAITDFPAEACLRFSVRPLECFGKAGEAISADFQFNRTETCTLKEKDVK